MKIKDCRMLIVDDEEPIRKLLYVYLVDFLKAKSVFTTPNAKEVINNITTVKEMDLVISDNDMPPGPSGIELLEYVKKEHPHILFILMSGYNVKQEAELAGADAFLQKPIILTDLQEVIEQVIGKK